MNYEIIKIDSSNKDFYNLMGFWFANKEYFTECGLPLFDETNKIWFLAIKNGIVIGFCALIKNEKMQKLCSMYIDKQYRRQGIATSLFRHRNNYIDPKITIRCTLIKSSKKWVDPLWKQFNMKITKESTNYYYYKGGNL